MEKKSELMMFGPYLTRKELQYYYYRSIELYESANFEIKKLWNRVSVEEDKNRRLKDQISDLQFDAQCNHAIQQEDKYEIESLRKKLREEEEHNRRYSIMVSKLLDRINCLETEVKERKHG